MFASLSLINWLAIGALSLIVLGIVGLIVAGGAAIKAADKESRKNKDE